MTSLEDVLKPATCVYDGIHYLLVLKLN